MRCVACRSSLPGYLLYSSTMSCSVTGIWMSSRSGRLRTTAFFSFGSSSDPVGDWAAPGVQVVAPGGRVLGGGPQRDRAPALQERGRPRAFAAFAREVAVAHLLPAPPAGGREAEPVDDVVEP